MKKASAICIYDPGTNQIYNLTINHNMNCIPLIQYKASEKINPYKYNNFNEVYETVLTIARNNGYYYSNYNEFGLTWYDIQWIDINNPTSINKYGYRRNEA